MAWAQSGWMDMWLLSLAHCLYMRTILAHWPRQRLWCWGCPRYSMNRLALASRYPLTKWRYCSAPCVPTTPCESTVSSCAQQMPQPHTTIGQKRFQHQGSKTLSSIVGAYKSAVSRHAHRLGYDFAWQSRFYDNIVRNNDALNRIENYIHNNPNNWKEDKFYQPITESVITSKIWNKDN